MWVVKVAVYHNLPPGGALRVVREFLQRSTERVDCDLYTLDFGPLDPFREFAAATLSTSVTEPAFRGTIHRQPVSAGLLAALLGERGRDLGLLTGIRRAERAVAAQINDGGYDIAYVHGCWYSQTPSLLGDLRLPAVYFMQEVRRASFEAEYHSATPWVGSTVGRLAHGVVEGVKMRRDERAARRPDVVLVNSRNVQADAEKHYGVSAQICHLGVDEEVFSLGMVDRERRVIAVGGLEEFKRQHEVVEALGAIPEPERPSLLLVYERLDLAYRSRLMELAQTRGVVVEERRGVTDEQLAGLIGASAAMVLTALKEPFGLVALESMACGIPVVAYDEGGYRETVRDGVNGLLVPRDHVALSAAIASVVSGARTFAPEAVRESVLPYWSWDASVERQLDALESLVPTR
jgi:glycosyltransferase involved in cell wall biosynthesis